MKSKTSADHKKQTIVVKDLKTKKNPKGGGFDSKHKDEISTRASLFGKK